MFIDDAIAWVPSMAFDCVIFALTLYKRIQVGRTIQNSLFTLMIRDGESYLLLCTLAHLKRSGTVYFVYAYNATY